MTILWTGKICAECPNKHENSMTNLISTFQIILWFSTAMPTEKAEIRKIFLWYYYNLFVNFLIAYGCTRNKKITVYKQNLYCLFCRLKQYQLYPWIPMFIGTPLYIYFRYLYLYFVTLHTTYLIRCWITHREHFLTI